MKKQTRTKTAMKLSAMIVSAFMMLAACTETVQKQKIPGATYMGGNNTITEICKELDSAGAAHVDIFREWAVDFADSAGKNAKLEDTWSDPGKMKADIGKCMDGWEQNHDYSDADCRMTAFLLLDGVIRSELTEDHYEGTYLMFDTEAIDNVDRYEILKENKDMFTTLYGEKSVTDDRHPESAFCDSWKEYLFVEKIAFEQPYQATRVQTIDELLDILSLRPEYFGEEGEPGPFVYHNGDYIGMLKRTT